jgi:hypothetical protein
MTIVDYITKDLGLSAAQYEAIDKLADVCGMKAMFESGQIDLSALASAFGNIKAEPKKKVKSYGSFSAADSEAADDHEDDEVDLSDMMSVSSIDDGGFNEDGDPAGVTTLKHFDKNYIDKVRSDDAMSQQSTDADESTDALEKVDVSTIITKIGELAGVPVETVREIANAAAESITPMTNGGGSKFAEWNDDAKSKLGWDSDDPLGSSNKPMAMDELVPLAKSKGIDVNKVLAGSKEKTANAETDEKSAVLKQTIESTNDMVDLINKSSKLAALLAAIKKHEKQKADAAANPNAKDKKAAAAANPNAKDKKAEQDYLTAEQRELWQKLGNIYGLVNKFTENYPADPFCVVFTKLINPSDFIQQSKPRYDLSSLNDIADKKKPSAKKFNSGSAASEYAKYCLRCKATGTPIVSKEAFTARMRERESTANQKISDFLKSIQ